MLHGIRAIYVYRKPTPYEPSQVDRFLTRLLIATVLGLFSVAVFKHTPMRVFTAIGLVLVVLEVRELGTHVVKRSTLYRRHIRYILGSYFYVLTVVSLVHLKEEIPRRNVRWLWATVLGIVVVYLATSRRPGLVRHQGRTTRWAVIATVTVAILFGSYVAYDLLSAAA
jgi:hypothetical protein